MTAPDDLAARRERRDGGGLTTCPTCGGSWWLVQAVTLGRDHSPTGYAAPVTCRDCGYVLVSGRTAPPDLESVDP